MTTEQYQIGYEEGYQEGWNAAMDEGKAFSAVPGGWKLVPEDATDEMVRATDKVNFANADTDGTMHNVWHAMLAASPTPPAEQQAQLAGPCVICGSDEPFTGTCGSGDPRALCKQAAPKAAPGGAAEPAAIVKWQLGGSLVAHLVGDVAEGDLLYKGAPPQQEVQGLVLEGYTLPPLPEPDLRDVGTKPQDIKDFLRGYATEYAKQALRFSQPAPAPLSEQQDAARYRYLRDGNWRECEKLESVIRLQLNSLWDAAIDAAIAAQKGTP